jgi:hypothetical protein
MGVSALSVVAPWQDNLPMKYPRPSIVRREPDCYITSLFIFNPYDVSPQRCKIIINGVVSTASDDVKRMLHNDFLGPHKPSYQKTYTQVEGMLKDRQEVIDR